MPVYCYQDSQGFLHERVFKMGEAPKQVKVRGNRVANRCFQAEHFTSPPSGNWPMECFASGVNPTQSEDLRRHLVEKGVPTEVSSDGNPIYRSASHRRRALRARGMFDRNDYQ